MLYYTRDPWNCTFVSENDPTAVYEGENYMRVGDANGTYTRANYMYVGWISDAVANTLQAVGIPSGARIDNVYFGFYLRSKGFSGETGLDVNVRAIQSTFNGSTLNWNNMDSRAPVGSLITSFRVASSETAGDKIYCSGDAALIAHIQNLLDTNTPLYGFRFSHTDISPAGDTAYLNYNTPWSDVWEDNPTLYIEYTPDTSPWASNISSGSVNHDSAVLTGQITYDGGTAVTGSGFRYCVFGTGNWVYKSHSTPGVETFAETITGLEPGTMYQWQAYAVNGAGTTFVYPTPTFTTKSIHAVAGQGGAGKTNTLTGATYLGVGGGGGAEVGAAVIVGQPTSNGGYGNPSGNGGNAVANTGSGGGGAGAGFTGGLGGSGLTVIRYKTEDAISAEYVTDAKAFNPSIAFQRGKLYTPYYVAGSKVTVNVATIGSGTSPVITCSDDITGLVNGMGVTIVNSGSAAINGNWIVANVNVGAKTFTITPGTTVTGNTPTGCKATFNAYVGIQNTSDLLAPIGWLKTSRSAMEMMTIKKKFKYISVIHEPFESNESIACSYTLDGTEYTAVADVQSPTELLFPMHKDGYGVDVTLSLASDGSRSLTPKVTAIHVVWSFVKNKVHQYSLLCVKGANGGKWNKNPKKAIQFLFENAGDLLTFEERFAGTYEGTIDGIDFNQGQASLSDDASGLVRLTVVEET